MENKTEYIISWHELVLSGNGSTLKVIRRSRSYATAKQALNFHKESYSPMRNFWVLTKQINNVVVSYYQLG